MRRQDQEKIGMMVVLKIAGRKVPAQTPEPLTSIVGEAFWERAGLNDKHLTSHGAFESHGNVPTCEIRHSVNFLLNLTAVS